MSDLYSIEKTSFINKKLATVYYSTTGKFIKSSYHRALVPKELAEKIAAEHGAVLKKYTLRHQH
jgi:hypothetical protein